MYVAPVLAPKSASSTLTTALLLLSFVALWTIYGAISHASIAVNHDTAEAYVWGREFQLGYYKHPPFWAWIAGVWFLVAPRTNWAFDMLTMVNAGVGLLGVWYVAGLYFQDRRRELAVLLLLL